MSQVTRVLTSWDRDRMTPIEYEHYLESMSDKNDLVGTLITDIVLQLLSYVAQVERDNIHQR